MSASSGLTVLAQLYISTIVIRAVSNAFSAEDAVTERIQAEPASST